MIKHVRGREGFTLVEVIVVAVIVMVLAAVAIPLYQGYVRDARRSSATGIASTVNNIAATAVQTGGDIVAEVLHGGEALSLDNSDFGDGARAIIPSGYCVSIEDGVVTVKHGSLPEDVTVRFAATGEAVDIKVQAGDACSDI